jgi:hypothetical protein
MAEGEGVNYPSKINWLCWLTTDFGSTVSQGGISGLANTSSIKRGSALGIRTRNGGLDDGLEVLFEQEFQIGIHSILSDPV